MFVKPLEIARQLLPCGKPPSGRLQVGKADNTCFNALNPRNAVFPQRTGLATQTKPTSVGLKDIIFG
ncbi:MAG: hypothetical protein KME21_21465 [Desmonostoc vinosum HA7617-LM4]|jgi:hypothetical protein|nr:hypothetical protein [Desmonostoc vinosum HA7617-LM4]